MFLSRSDNFCKLLSTSGSIFGPRPSKTTITWSDHPHKSTRDQTRHAVQTRTPVLKYLRRKIIDRTQNYKFTGKLEFIFIKVEFWIHVQSYTPDMRPVISQSFVHRINLGLGLLQFCLEKCDESEAGIYGFLVSIRMSVFPNFFLSLPDWVRSIWPTRFEFGPIVR